MSEKPTERPGGLLTRAVLKEETTWGLECRISLKCCYSLELGCQSTRISGMKWRALSDIVGVQLQQLIKVTI